MQNRIRVFTDRSHYSPEHRAYLTPILRAHWNSKTPLERLALYQTRYTNFAIVEDVAEADLCLLPMNWNYYVETNKVSLAARFVEQAQSAKKLVGIWAVGDLSLAVPFSGTIKFESSLYGSHRRPTDFALPAMFSDYLEIYFDKQIEYRHKQAKPVVGFCGHARSHPMRLLAWGAKNFYDHLAYKLNVYRPYHYPPPLIPSVVLRSTVLKRLAQSPRIETNFILRNRYRAGVTEQERQDLHHQSRVEFVNNIYHSDYTVCIRGTGNFSQRFYETLCLGRIPIFVNTDSALPYDFTIDWKKYCVWVEQHEINHIAEKVVDFHSQLSDEDFVELQRQCRRLWVEYVSPYGFYNEFYRHFDYVKTISSVTDV